MKHFEVPVRVYYEDTDAIGVVYHANYLNYFERCRADWMIDTTPINQLNSANIVFVVENTSLRYLKPAKLKDDLIVTLDIEDVTGASIIFKHTVLRNNEVLVIGNAQLVCVDLTSLRPKRIPSWFRESI